MEFGEFVQKEYMSEPEAQEQPAPGLVYFHIPLPEYRSFEASDFIGVKQEMITGHDHINDFCGKLAGIQLCYAGGFGYHAYGMVGWPRRARVVSAYLEKTVSGEWGGVKSIKTWKRLDDQYLSTIDTQVLWNKGSTVREVQKKNELLEFDRGHSARDE